MSMNVSGTSEIVCFGEILWDILPSGPLRGGAPMNVAYHLKKVHRKPLLITKIGDDEYGRRLIWLLDKDGVEVLYKTDMEHPTGLVYVLEGEGHEMTYDIVFPSAWDFIEWEPAYQDVVASADYFVFGTLASRNEVTRNTLFRLLEHAKKNVCDINIRPPHFDRDTTEFLLSKTNLLKMNLSELELIAGWHQQSGNTVEKLKFIQSYYHIDQLIVTKGGEGAVVLDGSVFYEHAGYTIQVKDTIGSGDSFLAGFLSQLLAGRPTNVALDFAAAVGALVATKAGGCPNYSLHEIDHLRNSQS